MGPIYVWGTSVTVPVTISTSFSYVLLMQHFNKQETFWSELKYRLLVFTRTYTFGQYTIDDDPLID